MQFHYRVIDENMCVQEGLLEAVDREAAQKIILDNHWQVIELDESNKILGLLTSPLGKKLSAEAISSFCSQLAMIIRTGANLIKGLEILRKQTKDKSLQRVIESLISGVSKGSPLSTAMRDCGALPELLVSLVAAGEKSGNLDSVLDNMAAYYERESFVRKKIGNAAVYPIILTSVLIIIIAFFINFVLPEITGMLTENGGELPLLTRIVIGGANFLAAKFWLIIIVIVLLTAIFFYLKKIPKYKLAIDEFKLRVPLLGKNMKKVITARFCRTMALFLKASIPIVPMLDSMESIVGNEVPRLALVRAKEEIIKGMGLAQAFSEEEFFEELVIQMMTVGEETGQLDDLMDEIAGYYDKQVELGIGRMVSLIEPIFTIAIGIFAGLMILSIALPIFNLSTTIQ